MIGNVTIGKIAEWYVRDQLKLLGFKVKVFGDSKPFDLLVDDKFRVEVKTAQISVENPWLKSEFEKSEKIVRINLPKNDYDVLAAVIPLLDGNVVIVYYKKSVVLKEFGNRKGTSFRVSSPSLLCQKINLGCLNPYEVFYGPKKKGGDHNENG